MISFMYNEPSEKKAKLTVDVGDSNKGDGQGYRGGLNTDSRDKMGDLGGST